MIRFLGFCGVRSPSFVSRNAELKRKTEDRDRTPLRHKRITATEASKGWFTDGHERADGQFLANVKLVLKISPTLNFEVRCTVHSKSVGEKCYIAYCVKRTVTILRLPHQLFKLFTCPNLNPRFEE